MFHKIKTLCQNVRFYHFILQNRILILHKCTNVQHFLFLLFSLLFIKIVILPSKKPRWRIAPYISTIVKDQMVLSSCRQNILHRFSIHATVFVPTHHTVRRKAFCIPQKIDWWLLPSIYGRKWRLSPPLSPNPSANTISINSCSFCININLK